MSHHSTVTKFSAVKQGYK